MRKVIYVWDETNSNTKYLVVNNHSDATYTQVGLGFFVKAVAGNLNFISSMQVHQGTAPFNAATSPTSQIMLIVGSCAGSASTMIKFIEGTTNGFYNPKDHYMIDLLGGLNDQIIELIENKYYFTMHVPRRSGKTILLHSLMYKINTERENICLVFSL